MQIVVAYLAALASFLAIDLVWLGYVARDFYRSQLGPLMADEINWAAGLGFYALYIVGVLIFAVQPAIATGSATRAALLGALFGFFCYATYDLTNLATLRGFPARLAALDIAWGTVLTMVAALVGYAAAARF